jgi:hypothetical protein
MKKIYFSNFISFLKKEMNISSPYKFTEEIIRYNFYKSLIYSGVDNEEIVHEANFENGTNDKVDMKFKDNFMEIKYNRVLENGSFRSYDIYFRNLILDFCKLKSSKSNNKFILYVFDNIFEEELTKRCDYLLLNNFEINIKKIMSNSNKTMNIGINNYSKLKINSRILFKDKISINKKFITENLKKHNPRYINIIMYEVLEK